MSTELADTAHVVQLCDLDLTPAYLRRCARHYADQHGVTLAGALAHIQNLAQRAAELELIQHAVDRADEEPVQPAVCPQCGGDLTECLEADATVKDAALAQLETPAAES